MSKPILTEPRTKAVGLAVLLVGIAILAYTNWWWPGIVAVIGMSTIVKQLLRKKVYEAILSILIFGGISFTAIYKIGDKYFVPVILMIAALYVLFRAFFLSDQEDEIDREEEQNKELEEDQEDTNS
jgi:hypothetical protein